MPIPQPAPSIFPQVESHVDVTSIIAKRLNAMRKLQENPTDPEALKMMYNSQRDVSTFVAYVFSKKTGNYSIICGEQLVCYNNGLDCS